MPKELKNMNYFQQQDDFWRRKFAIVAVLTVVNLTAYTQVLRKN